MPNKNANTAETTSTSVSETMKPFMYEDGSRVNPEADLDLLLRTILFCYSNVASTLRQMAKASGAGKNVALAEHVEFSNNLLDIVFAGDLKLSVPADPIPQMTDEQREVLKKMSLNSWTEESEQETYNPS
jgi:hypothetical protein